MASFLGYAVKTRRSGYRAHKANILVRVDNDNAGDLRDVAAEERDFFWHVDRVKVTSEYTGRLSPLSTTVVVSSLKFQIAPFLIPLYRILTASSLPHPTPPCAPSSLAANNKLLANHILIRAPVAAQLVLTSLMLLCQFVHRSTWRIRCIQTYWRPIPPCH
jgi:hypothetical protein